jgi:dTDP-4-dehydrorhamnose 3,5-epimerase
LIFTPTSLPGVLIVDVEPVEDERGHFARIFDAEAFAAQGIRFDVLQVSVSFNVRAGTVRGMHFQAGPHGERKLVRCTRGRVHDVVVDLRPDSPTFVRSLAVELSAGNGRALYVPPGLAHGFQTLENASELLYAIADPYRPEAASGVRYDDPAFGIDWPLGRPTCISAQDEAWPDFGPGGADPRG